MANSALTYWQAGLESTAGTPVAATRKIYEIGPIPSEQRMLEYVRQSRQSFIENFDAVETAVKVEWEMEGVVNYSDLAWWAELMWKGGVSPTGAGPYTRTYNGAGASDNLKSATFEVNDGVGSFRLPYTVCTAWELSGEGGGDKAGIVGLKTELLAQKLTAGHTMTASLADRDLRGTYIPFVQTQFFINSTAGTIGTTENGTLMKFTISGDNKVSPLYYGGDSGYFGATRREKRYVEVALEILFDSTSYAEFSTNFQTNAGRYCQIKCTSGTSSLTFNFYTKFEAFEYPEDGPTRRVALLGRSIYDATLAYDWQAVLVNSVATI